MFHRYSYEQLVKELQFGRNDSLKTSLTKKDIFSTTHGLVLSSYFTSELFAWPNFSPPKRSQALWHRLMARNSGTLWRTVILQLKEPNSSVLQYRFTQRGRFSYTLSNYYNRLKLLVINSSQINRRFFLADENYFDGNGNVCAHKDSAFVKAKPNANYLILKPPIKPYRCSFLRFSIEVLCSWDNTWRITLCTCVVVNG